MAKSKRQVIGCEQLIAAIMLFAQKSSQYEYQGAILQDEWEEVTVESLIECVRKELGGKELVMEAVK